MNSKPLIHLSYECHEPFWKLKKQEKEIICKTCSKSIVDFRNRSSDEIIKMLKDSNRNTCVIYYEDQILINEKTVQGPSLPKIIVASVIATISSLTATAQKETKALVKTEQTPIDTKIDESIIAPLPPVECYQIPDRLMPDTKIQPKPRKYYLSWRFPFIRKYYRPTTHMGNVRFL